MAMELTELYLNWLVLENEEGDSLPVNQRKEVSSMEPQLRDFLQTTDLDHSYALVDKNNRKSCRYEKT